MEYEDFALRIEPKRGDVYPVSVLRSPAGEARSSFSLPFDADEIGDLLLQLGQTVRGSAEPTMRHAAPAATGTRPEQIGEQLFTELFTGPVRSLLDRSLGMLHGSDRGLRIKLHIDPEEPSLAQLASLPWELLYRKETRDFLNLSRFTPVMRYLEVERPYSPVPLEPPLRILVVISDPADYERLDLERERSLIEESWATQEGVQVEFVERATTLTVQDRLAEQPYHVLHYMGHGDFYEDTGKGVLLMEDEQGLGAKVDGSTLGVLLRDVPTLRLVFLNACETAKATQEQGCDPFAGVAAAMVLAGIPAVVAMQFPISDRAAITFSQRFYSLLSRGEPVDAAVAEGRRAIRVAQPETMEWATPVLFMRAPQGVIFEMAGVAPVEVPLPEAQEPPPKVETPPRPRLNPLVAAVVGLIIVLAIAAPRLYEFIMPGPTATAVLTVTPSGTPCPPVSGPFAQAWNAALLGCALGGATSRPMAEEVFEHGKMFWWCEDQCETDQPVGQIVVLFDDGHKWELHPDKWKESDPEYSCPEATPADCPPTPKRGFGLVWCGLEEKIRDELGKVTECEKAYTGSMQQFERGFMLLFDDGTIYEFGGEGSGEWTAIEPTDTPTRTPAPTPTDTLTPTPIPTDTPELYFSEDFSEQALGNSWRVSGPRVGVSNGVLRLEGDDTEYPLVSTVQSPFPERGGFRVDVRFRYATVSNWGAGFAAAEDVPSRGTDVNVQHRFLGVWQDRNELLRMFTHGVTMYAAPEPDTSWHIIELEYKANWYELTLDDIPVYSSQAAIDRPTALWFGNTAEVQGEGTWPVMEVDYVHIHSTD